MIDIFKSLQYWGHVKAFTQCIQRFVIFLINLEGVLNFSVTTDDKLHIQLFSTLNKTQFGIFGFWSESKQIKVTNNWNYLYSSNVTWIIKTKYCMKIFKISLQNMWNFACLLESYLCHCHQRQQSYSLNLPLSVKLTDSLSVDKLFGNNGNLLNGYFVWKVQRKGIEAEIEKICCRWS